MNVPHQPPTSKKHQSPDQREDIKRGTGTYLSSLLPAPRITGGRDGVHYRRRAMTPVGDITLHPSERRDERWGEEKMKGLWRQRTDFYTLSYQSHGTGTSTFRFALPCIGIGHRRLSMDHIRILTRSKAERVGRCAPHTVSFIKNCSLDIL